MYRQHMLVLFLVLLCRCVLSSETNSFVLTTTESTKEHSTNISNVTQVNPQIYSMQIFTNVSNRFARTLITSKVRNLKNTAQETTFSVILPENAFISEFEMEIKGIVYKAYVKEKEEAKKIYKQAVATGQSAAHVELSARDSKTFTVSVNIEPESKTIFRLVYEELLQRQLGQYELVINIHPGQIVVDLGVQVHINESRPLTFVHTPSLRTGNEITKNQNLNPSAGINVEGNSATVEFHPDAKEQSEFAHNLGGAKENGLSGQFVVQYDVARDPDGGEVLVRDGYFVHFFAPSELKPLPKHVVFVLDHSGSMIGTKFEQLTKAMQNILSDLHPNDVFHVVRFSSRASVWNSERNEFISTNFSSIDVVQYGQLEPHLREANLPEAISVSKDNIDKAKNIIKNEDNMWSTNIIEGLEVGLFLLKKTQEKFPKKYQPMVIFLTDGLPNEGIYSGDEITALVGKLNKGPNRAAIFSLSFGDDADKDFLKNLSAQNLGFSRHIYVAADASLQLQNFYRTISSPLLGNVTFKYVDEVTDVTEIYYPMLFNGSELVVAGRTSEDLDDLYVNVTGLCITGLVDFHPVQSKPVSSLERLWAYLTVKHILQEMDNAANSTELTNKALDLSLKYSFVTPVSSLVVVKPNDTSSVETDESATPPDLEYGRPNHYTTPFTRMSAKHHPLNIHKGDSSFDMAEEDEMKISDPIIYQVDLVPINYTIPQWLNDLKKNNQNITTTQGIFKLGQSGADISRPACPKTPLNGTGICLTIFDCPEVFSYLDDVDSYLKYFCPLNEYAGVCCPASIYNA